MSYSSNSDPLCYPLTSVLRNKLGTKNQAQLDEFENAVYLARFEQTWPSGKLDVAHYLSLHHHLFQDVYEWAGTLRTIRIGKDGAWFCYPEYIARELGSLFRWLESEQHFQPLADKEFATMAARFLAELNAIHPFREGNGRTQMSFLTLLVDNAGLPFHAQALQPKTAMDAMVASFRGDLKPLEKLIEGLVRGG